MNVPLRLLLADDHRIMIDGLIRILADQRMIANITSCADGREAVRLAISGCIDCIIMDINMPLLSGLEATRQIRERRPEVRIIIMSMLSEPAIVSQLLAAGADAFVHKGVGKDELLRALETVIDSGKYVSPDISQNLYAELSERGAAHLKELTARELEIIRLIADGKTNREIAALLFLSTTTVDTHRKNILAKLQLKNTAALVKYAVERGLL